MIQYIKVTINFGIWQDDWHNGEIVVHRVKKNIRGFNFSVRTSLTQKSLMMDVLLEYHDF